MKRYLMALAILSICATACNKEKLNDGGIVNENGDGYRCTLCVNLPTPEDSLSYTVEENEEATEDTENVTTKAIVSDEGKVCWESGDQITVYPATTYVDGGEGAKAYTFTLVSGEGTSSGVFECKDFSGTPQVAVYPASYALDFQKTANNRLRFKVPAVSEWSADMPVPVVMAANITDPKSVQFKHLAALFKFSFTDIPNTVNCFTLSADKGVSDRGIAGKFYFTYTNINSGASPKISGEPVNSFTYKFPSGTKAATFYVPVNQGMRTPYHISFGIIDSDGNVTSQEDTRRALNGGKAFKSSSTTGEPTLNRGDLHIFPAFSVQDYINSKDKVVKIKFTNIWEDLMQGETTQLKYELYGGAYDPGKTYNVTFSSSDTGVATVSASGKITAKAKGKTTITATVSDGGESVSRTYYVTDYSSVAANYSSSMEYFTKGLSIHSNSVMQSWDFFDDCLYFTQINRTRHISPVTMADYSGDKANNKYMALYYAGHCDNMCVERHLGNDYIWINNYGTRIVSSGEEQGYDKSQTLSRITFQKGAKLAPWEIEEQYVFWGSSSHLIRLSAAYDEDNDLLAVLGYNNSSLIWKVKVFPMDEVRALKKESVTLDKISYGGDPDGKSEAVTNKVKTIQAYNLAHITPVYDFSVPFWDGGQHIVQGFDFHHGKMYYMFGDGASGGFSSSDKNSATLRVVNPNSVKIVKTIDVPWVNTKSVISKYASFGYFEPEGVKVKNGKIFIGWAGINKNESGDRGDRIVNIFQFPL